MILINLSIINNSQFQWLTIWTLLKNNKSLIKNPHAVSLAKADEKLQIFFGLFRKRGGSGYFIVGGPVEVSNRRSVVLNLDNVPCDKRRTDGIGALRLFFGVWVVDVLLVSGRVIELVQLSLVVHCSCITKKVLSLMKEQEFLNSSTSPNPTETHLLELETISSTIFCFFPTLFSFTKMYPASSKYSEAFANLLFSSSTMSKLPLKNQLLFVLCWESVRIRAWLLRKPSFFPLFEKLWQSFEFFAEFGRMGRQKFLKFNRQGGVILDQGLCLIADLQFVFLVF